MRQMTWIEGELYYRKEEGKKWKHYSCHEHAQKFDGINEQPETTEIFGGHPLHSPGWPLYQFLRSHNWELIRYDDGEISEKRGKLS